MLRLALQVLLFGIGVYVLLAGLLFVFQNQLLFFPQSRFVATPDDFGMAYEDVSVQTGDGETLHGWWIPADVPRGTLIFFHGNADNISIRLDSARALREMGLNVFLFDYRGYGRSTGSPSEDGLYADAEAVWRYVTETRPESTSDADALAPDRVVLFARSLGGGPATWLATRTSPAALVLDSSFTSVPDVAAHHYGIFPVRWLARTSFDNEARLADVDCPVFVVHSPDDPVIPFSHGTALHDAASEPKRFLEVRGSHADGLIADASRYRTALLHFLQDEAGLTLPSDRTRPPSESGL